MSARLSSSTQLLVRLFALGLRLYPRAIRRRYAAEMQAVFRLEVADAAHQGAWTLFTLACREVRDLPLAIFSAYFHAVEVRMQPNFPSTSDRTPWLAALLSLLPFFIAGPLRIILSYQPGWMPREHSLYYLLILLLSSLAVTGGFAIGIIKKFPRWAYPYAIYLAFSLYLLLGYALYLFHGSIWQDNFYLFLAAIFLILWLPPFRSFYRRILQDWTLLTYSLYGFFLYLFASLDYEETPLLSLLVLLPSLLALSAALAHLRIRSSFVRIAVLLAGASAGLFFWLLPVFQGLVHSWIGVGMGLFLLPTCWIIQASILLAPMWLIPMIVSWRASRASR